MTDSIPGNLERMLGGLEDESAGYAPTRFELDDDRDRAALEELLAARGERPLVKRDTLFAQVCELLKARDPSAIHARAALDYAARGFLRERGGEGYGTWVYYPWRRALVRVLPAAEFVEVRTSRNRYKITAEEQEKLGRATVGIVGLSAGHAIAVGLALERVGSRFRLADFDSMELSNMNRVGCGVGGIGVNKAVLIARTLYELDPYLDISVFSEGITTENMDAFLKGEPKLDLLIEECDDLYMKVRLREAARAVGIPVVMETNDRGLLDVERFDVEPSRPIFHGLLEGVRSEELKGLNTEGKTPFMLRILGEDMSPRLAASLIEIDKTINGWPQLASGNLLGGAVVTDISRRILLGQRAASGRYMVDLEELVGGGQRVAEPARVTLPGSLDGALAAEPKERVGSKHALPSREEIEWLVERAAMAPSGGNDQPWRFVWRSGGELDCYLDRERSGSFLDYERAASHVALGATAENATIAATVLKRAVRVDVCPTQADPDLVYRLTFGEPSEAIEESPLAAFVEHRVTNRRLGARRPLDSSHAQALCDAARERTTELTLVTDPTTLSRVGVLLGEVDRFRFFCERLHTAMVSELRFGSEQVLATRDGIDLETLELDAAAMAGVRLLSKPKTAAFLRSLGKGERLESSARKSVAAASAVGILSVAGTDSRAHLQAGRAMQRVWLTATQLGLSLQPMAVAPYLFARLTHGGGEGFSEAEIVRLRAIHERFTRLFPSKPDHSQPMLFRLAHAPPPSARSLRRPIGAILKGV